MDEPIPRVSFDATLDELVDVVLRYQNATKVAQSWRRTAMFSSGAVIGVLFLLVSSPVWRQGRGVFILFVVGLLLAVLVGFLAGRAHDHSQMRRVRQYLVEQLRGARTVRCEIELRPSGVWIQQDNVEMLFKWGDVVAIEDGAAGVELFLKNSLVIARGRAFSTASERDIFLSHARNLAAILPGCPSPSPPTNRDDPHHSPGSNRG
jgi:hypothetical protein